MEVAAKPKVMHRFDKQEVPVKGLCVTCNHIEDCLPRVEGKAIWFCEEFDDSSIQSNLKPAMQNGATTQQVKQEKRLGLCMNCENAENCQLPRPEGGVWYCEEYR